MARLAIHLLGPFHVTLDGEPLTGFESNKVRALLAYLAVEAHTPGGGRPYTREALAGLLWPDQPDASARRNLSQALFNLRQTIRDEQSDPPFLDITRGTVQFNPGSDHWLDVAEFGEATSRRSGEAAVCDLQSAVELYRGEFLAGFFVDESVPFAEWVTLLRERLHRQMLDALYRLAEHYEQQRDYEQARRCAHRQVELEPWREEAHYQLMRLLARSGRRSAALAQYETCRRVLADELGVEPGETIQRLYRRIRSVDEVGAHNLPPQPTPFVGREAELRDIGRRLLDPHCRLLTLIGPGGIGKTRLAIQAACENRTAFLHGVCFAPLTGVTSAGFLAPAIADALHLRPEGQTDLKTQLLAALAGREMLLVLDNMEHLVEDGADLLMDILRAAPEVRLLVTSRERLNLYGEMVFDVGGLDTPQEADGGIADYSAVRLFLQSAERAQAGFTPNDGEWADVARICRLVEGMPLAIELAAAWVRALPCRDIAAEIERNLTFLSTTMRGVPARHRSVHAAFDHSWERLSAEERRAFGKLAVFRGRFDRQAASQVAGATLPILSTLIDKSFLREIPPDRYALHELMRQYAAEKLAQDAGAAAATQDEHSRYYAGLVNGAFERFHAGEQRQALDVIERELENVRVAWQYAIDQRQYPHLEKLLPGLYIFGFNRSEPEGYALFEKAVAALENAAAEQSGPDEELNDLLGRLLWRWGYFVRTSHPSDEKTELLFQRSIALLRLSDDRTELVQAMLGLGRFLDAGGRYSEARQILEESIEISRQLQDPRYLAQSLVDLGGVARRAGEITRARQLIQEGMAIHRQLGDLMGVVHALGILGGLAYQERDYAEAKRLYLEGQAMYEELGDPGGATVALNNAGHACMELGEYETAAHYLREALQRHAALYRSSRFLTNILHGLAELAFKMGRYTQAYELATFVRDHPMTYPPTVEMARRMSEELETRLPPEVASAARARVRTWTLDEAAWDACLRINFITS